LLGWKSIAVKQDVLIQRKEPKNGRIYYFKGVGEINATPEAVINLCKDITRSAEWDALFKEARIVSVLDENTRIIHLMYETRTCVLKTARDFCIIYRLKANEDGSYLLAGKSVTHPKCPNQKGFIRGEVLESGFLIKPKPGFPNVSIVTYITQVDLKGIPPTIINLVAERQPLVIAGLRKALTGSRVTVVPS